MPATHNGSAKSIYRILIGEYSSGLTKYIYAEAIRDWTQANDGPYVGLAAEFLGWFNGDREQSRELRDAFEACRNITEAYRLRAAVESSLENYRRHVQPKPAEPEPEAEQEVANGQAEEKPADEAQADSAADTKVA